MIEKKTKWFHVYIPALWDCSGIHFDKMMYFIRIQKKWEKYATRGHLFFTSAFGKNKNFKTLGVKLQSATWMAFLWLWFYMALDFHEECLKEYLT